MVLKGYRDEADAENECPLCRREFHGSEKQECLTFIDGELGQLPEGIAAKEQELDVLVQQVGAGVVEYATHSAARGWGQGSKCGTLVHACC